MESRPLIPSFHAHVYYIKGTEEETIARDLYSRISKLGDTFVMVGSFHQTTVGPHTRPMFTLGISHRQFTSVVSYLMLNHQTLSVLIHPETGDDLKDHTIHALWLGEKLALDYSKL